ncbi:MAG: hypothetical protein ACYSSN_12845 [Planctomycetota bacterium]|jgi:hypothetical protein
MDSYETLKKKLDKELEKLSALIENWQYQLPEELLAACRTVLDGYQRRCTAKSSYHQKRLKKE